MIIPNSRKLIIFEIPEMIEGPGDFE